MSKVNTHMTAYEHKLKNLDETSELNFDNRVLQFIRENRPEGTLNDLITKLKSLDPDNAYSLQQLNKALLYTDTTLRGDPNFRDYTKDTLDKNTSQMLGVNMMVNSMMMKWISSPDDKDDDNSFL
ncbi:hypothetical protein [Erwinia piriflorinigrans]|uniref:Uncharacterized protein n=1 Tax=Erwinia piriflorinigrans CFBP 5888 TaxID=1161919 RepID=V5Z4G9_9GAMM|nr:hypothetical protein [Erwinia piriflorinigrans]CCG86216.1 hypothetical protein EPIR_0851 [Erwinia piriflorinigrans CFBP 5888]